MPDDKRQDDANSRQIVRLRALVTGSPFPPGARAIKWSVMIFWVFAFLIAAATAGMLLAALRGRERGPDEAASDVQVYRDQLKEVERDLARGVLTEAEAEAVRTEVARRLLAADRRGPVAATSSGQVWPLVALVAAVLVGGGALLYREIGVPGYADLPMAQRLASIDAAAASRIGQEQAEEIAGANLPDIPAADPDFLALMDQLRSVLAERPNDVRGLALLAENEARLGNFAAARAAQERILEIKGDAAGPLDLLGTIDVMVFAAGGYVSPEAEEHIRRLVAIAPDNGAGQYYAGLTLVQNGRPDQAFPIWRRLLENGPADAPWVPIIRQEIAGIAAAAGIRYEPPGLRGPDADAMAAADAMSEEDRQAMIEGMVEGLAARLATEGGTAEEWAQLITALGVLGETERAEAIVAEARTVFAASDASLALIEGAASRAGLSQ